MQRGNLSREGRYEGRSPSECRSLAGKSPGEGKGVISIIQETNLGGEGNERESGVL